MSDAKLILLLFGGLGTLAFMLAHPIGPALFIFAMTPFEGLFFILFGLVSNFVNLVPLLVFLVRPPREGLLDAFLGTRVQRAATLMILGMLISYLLVISDKGVAALIKYSSDVYLLLVAGIVAYAFRQSRYIPLVVKVYVVSMVAMTVVSAADFYLSLDLFPVMDALTLADASDEGPLHRWRLRGAGGMSPNRFGLALLLPLSLSVGWLIRRRTLQGNLLPLVCTAVLSFGLVGTVSRSAILGASCGAMVIVAVVTRMRLTGLIAVASVGGTIALGVVLVASQIGVDEKIGDRFSGDLVSQDASARTGRWLHGLRLWADSPIIGVGSGVGETKNVKTRHHAKDPHNGYIRHLSWTGLLGFSLLVYFLYVLGKTLVAPSDDVPDEIAYWRPYFLAGFVAIAAMNLFVSYLVERFLFVIVAYAASLERARRTVPVQRMEMVSPFLADAHPEGEEAGAVTPSGQ